MLTLEEAFIRKLNARCRRVARRMLLKLNAEGYTLTAAQYINRTCDAVYCWYARYEPTGFDQASDQERYRGIIGANVALRYYFAVADAEREEGMTEEKMRESFCANYKEVVVDRWTECRLALEEVAGVVKPMRINERDKASLPPRSPSTQTSTSL